MKKAVNLDTLLDELGAPRRRGGTLAWRIRQLAAERDHHQRCHHAAIGFIETQAAAASQRRRGVA